MFKLSASLALLALAQATLAAVSITNPVAGTVWKQGSKVTITWTATGTDATGTIPIELMNGVATSLQPVTTINDSEKASASGKYTWTVPTDIADGSDYTVAFGTSPNQYYSHYFTIGKATASSSASASGSAAPLSTAAMKSTALPSMVTASGSAASALNATASAPTATTSVHSAGARSAVAAFAIPAAAAAAAIALM
ncbi:Ser-Thr-rich glycosyl-phosphatidyl-inositol-anchored membrane family-domain-containing protein [Umbelopsis sp. PMI_123]|nr:Ser-Thr-rich glycosyl-phosphatidyl-inositol-anchored membrane family-domain-containing protein [Umbelopsis sp. PMI_123]